MLEDSNETETLEPDDHGRTLEVTVHNEDNGAVAKIVGKPGALVQAVVDEMYSEFRLERQADDRLRCEGDGGDVFSHENEHLEAYAKRFCSTLVWLFVGGQGGARARAGSR